MLHYLGLGACNYQRPWNPQRSSKEHDYAPFVRCQFHVMQWGMVQRENEGAINSAKLVHHGTSESNEGRESKVNMTYAVVRTSVKIIGHFLTVEPPHRNMLIY